MMTDELVLIVEPYGVNNGVRVFLPLNEVAKAFAELLRQKTLTEQDINKLKGLGYEVRTKEIRL